MSSQTDKGLERILELANVLDRDRVSVSDFTSVIEVLVAFAKETRDLSEGELDRLREGLEIAVSGIQEKVDAKLATVRDGRDGKDGQNGAPGANGKDSDPEEVALLVLDQLPEPQNLNGEDIRNYLEALPEGDKLSIDAIEGLREELERHAKRVGAMNAGGGSSSAFGGVGHSPLHEQFTMNGSDTTVTLSAGVAAAGTAIFVRYQGQLLDLTTQYTVSGNKVTLVGFTPESDTIISITYWP